MEAKGAGASALGRKCVVMRWADISKEGILELVERGAGALLLLLPHNYTEVDGETVEVGRDKTVEVHVHVGTVETVEVHVHVHVRTCR